MEDTHWCVGERCFSLLGHQNRYVSCYFMHHGREMACISFFLPLSLCQPLFSSLIDCSVHLTSLIHPPDPQPGQPLVSMRVAAHVSVSSSNVIQAYSFHLVWRTNIPAPKNRGSCFSFLSTTHYSLQCLKHCWPRFHSLIALVWPTLHKSGSQRLINCLVKCKLLTGVTTGDVTKLLQEWNTDSQTVSINS